MGLLLPRRRVLRSTPDGRLSFEFQLQLAGAGERAVSSTKAT
jgi:hypothetical protein